MARAPQSRASTARQHVVQVYLNDDEEDHIAYMAIESGIGRAPYIRMLINRDIKAQKESRKK